MLGVPWFLRSIPASARLVCLCGIALALVMGGPGRAEEVPRSRTQIALSFAPVVRAAAPAVVNIYARKQQRRAYADPFSSDPFFRFFFPDFRGRPLPDDVPENSLGSGVIVDPDGLIVTNHHVIEDADGIMVESRHALAGATVANLSPGLNRDLRLDLFESGVIVLKVDAPTTAARLRLRRGDLIRTVAEQPVAGVAQLKTILREWPLPWRLEVERAGRKLAVVIGG